MSPPVPARAPRELALFAATLSLSAALLFTIEPLLGKLLLPALGGSPAVWSGCMAFFQALLLGGYLYAHLVATRLGPRSQVVVHALVLLLPALVLPVALSPAAIAAVPRDHDPTGWLLRELAVTAGLPFFVASTTGPLVQRWFSRSAHPAARDPYFLYGASNLGSLAGLLAYPLLIERRLSAGAQGRAWSVAYAALALLTMLCGATVWRARADAAAPSGDAAPADTAPSDAPPAGAAAAEAASPAAPASRWRWLALSLVPSSWLLGVTHAVSIDVAAVPLLWVVPLAIYLLTFVVAFARRPLVPEGIPRRALPLAVLAVLFAMALGVTQPLWVLTAVHLLAFLAGSLACHAELARTRPPAARLTDFSLGGGGGGGGGGLVTGCSGRGACPALGPIEYPLTIPLHRLERIEYPLAMIAACLLVPAAAGAPARLWRVSVVARVVLVATAIAALASLRSSGGRAGQASLALGFGLLALVSYSFRERPRLFAAGAAAMLGAMALVTGTPPARMERSFYGLLRVGTNAGMHRLLHGTTLHGIQLTDPAMRGEPLTYYHRLGPVPQVFDAFEASEAPRTVGLVGLGAGSLAAYSRPGQSWSIYEIDPAVVRVARDPRYFTFLQELEARGEARYILGDARLRLADAADGAFGLLVLDAFSSDAVPVHLMTREALALYVDKIAEHGLVAFHVSSRYMDLEPVLAALAADHAPPLAARIREDFFAAFPASPSTWVLMARDESDLGPVTMDGRWRTLAGERSGRPWTDDFSDVVGALR